MERVLPYQLSVLHIILLKIPHTRGHITRLQVKTESHSQTFAYKINTLDIHLNRTSAYDQETGA